MTAADTDVIVALQVTEPSRPPGDAVAWPFEVVTPPAATERPPLTVWGYKRRIVGSDGLLEMREVTFAADPRNLLAVGRFLLHMAEEVDAGTFGDVPRYLRANVDDWKPQAGDAEVVVSPVER